MQNIATWNILGAHHVSKWIQIKEIIAEHKLQLVAILETKLDLHSTMKAAKFIKSKWTLNHNLLESPYGRIMILSNLTSFMLNPILSHKQFIHLHAFHIPSATSMYFTIIYVESHVIARQNLHDYLPHLAQETHLWILFGDFNYLLNIDDRQGRNPVSLTEISPLNSSIANASLVQIPFTGSRFSWSNKSRSGHRIISKIDNGFCNFITVTKWPTIKTYLPPPLLSDHSPRLYLFQKLPLKSSLL